MDRFSAEFTRGICEDSKPGSVSLQRHRKRCIDDKIPHFLYYCLLYTQQNVLSVIEMHRAKGLRLPGCNAPEQCQF